MAAGGVPARLSSDFRSGGASATLRRAVGCMCSEAQMRMQAAGCSHRMSGFGVTRLDGSVGRDLERKKKAQVGKQGMYADPPYWAEPARELLPGKDRGRMRADAMWLEWLASWPAIADPGRHAPDGAKLTVCIAAQGTKAAPTAESFQASDQARQRWSDWG